MTIDFFSKFPTIPYELDGIVQEVVNIAISEITVKTKIDVSYILWKYEIVENETPIIISDKLYKTMEYYWVLLYVNNIVNPYLDWYMTQDELETYAASIYEDINDIHHFEKFDPITQTNSLIDNYDSIELFKKYKNGEDLGEYIFPVSNIMYERSKNDKRKIINIINPKYINEFVTEFRKVVGNK